jgi:hypothetical protein
LILFFYEEYPEKDGWWINELESLDIDTKDNSNELNEKENKSNLLESIKKRFIEEYEHMENIKLIKVLMTLGSR